MDLIVFAQQKRGNLLGPLALFMYFLQQREEKERQYQMTESIPEYTNEEEEGEGQCVPDKQYQIREYFRHIL